MYPETDLTDSVFRWPDFHTYEIHIIILFFIYESWQTNERGQMEMYYSKEEAEKEYGQLSDFYKNDLKSKIWKAGTIGTFGPTFFSFDKIKI